MRKRFEQQLSLGILPISEVEVDMKTRHQLPPLLKALQHIFTTPSLSSQVFTLLEEHVLKGKKKTGRLGMSLWEILVLGLVRKNLNIDHDFLLDHANNHETLRGILGVGRSDFVKGVKYKYQTVVDNVSLLDEDIIRKINTLVVEASHGLIKKKEEAEVLALNIKVDSYVVESNIHFPTDLNLLWDSGRKCLDIIGRLRGRGVMLSGWAKHNDHRLKFHRVYRKASEIHRLKGGDYQTRLKTATRDYVERSLMLSIKVKQGLTDGLNACKEGVLSVRDVLLLKDLLYFSQMLDKHIDLVDRRILQGEKIPHSEKVFSIFEPHVEWLSKGKPNRKVELGHNVSIATDQYHFIIDFEIMVKMADPQAGRQLGERIATLYSSICNLASISLDRGYYSSLLKKFLSKDFGQVIMPKRGKKTAAQEVEESEEGYKKLRRAHSAVESNINQLEHNGLDKCRDKGLRGFKRYVALGILSYNLHRMGKLLAELEVTQNRCRGRAA